MAGRREAAKPKVIPSRIRDERVSAAIKDVLGRIKARCPADYERLCVLVRCFRWLSPEEDDGGTVGQWVPCRDAPPCAAYERWLDQEIRKLYPGASEHQLELVSQNERHDPHLQRGEIALSHALTKVDDDHLLATIAHELGHAATRPIDFERRERVIRNGEWASEACADYYAYKWGFGRQIRRRASTRDWAHHGVLPGGVIEVKGPTGWIRYRVTRRFYYRVATTTP